MKGGVGQNDGRDEEVKKGTEGGEGGEEKEGGKKLWKECNS